MVSVSLVLTAVLKTHTHKRGFLIMFCLGCFQYYNVPIASSCSLRNANSVQLVVCSFDPAHIKTLKKRWQATDSVRFCIFTSRIASLLSSVCLYRILGVKGPPRAIRDRITKSPAECAITTKPFFLNWLTSRHLVWI